ncbi:MAG: hypothetical protein MJE68_03840, partial [Proteobacteria bacterium]|nr:hypothetical protein [Pseudomonadota bacterium]
MCGAVNWEEVDEPDHFSLLQRLQIGFYILDTDSAIVPTTGEGFSIRRECSAENPSGMSCQGSDFLPTFDQPERYRSMSGADECFPIWKEIKVISRSSVLECAEECPIGDRPQLDESMISGTGESSAIRGKSEGVNPNRITIKLRD